jgi:hypothetical protein
MKIYLLLMLFFVSCNGQGPIVYFQEPQILPEYELVNDSIKAVDLYGGKVDILWVVDNSGSMGEEQVSLQKNFNQFIKEFTNLKQADWKMGLISTDIDEDPYLGFKNSIGGEFNYLDPNPEQRFIDAVGRLGISGTYDEREMDSVINVLDRNPDFVRPGAYLAIIFLTDEPDHSSIDVFDFNKYLLTLKNNNNELIEVHGGFTSRDLPICPAGETWSYVGSNFETMINFFKGSYFDLCSYDFGKELALLANKIAAKLEYPRVLLKDKPYLCSIEVSFKGEKLPPGKIENGGKWFFDEANNSIVFYSLSFVNNDQEILDISYTINNGYPAPNEDCLNTME